MNYKQEGGGKDTEVTSDRVNEVGICVSGI